MAKLTNRQMDVLAERVTDLLEEAHKEQSSIVTQSPEYQNFEKTFKDDITLVWRQKVEELNELEALAGKIKAEATTLARELGYITGNWASMPPNNLLERYLKEKKRELYPHAEFDREKTLRKVQADILLSDVDNPEQLVASIVNKLKSN